MTTESQEDIKLSEESHLIEPEAAATKKENKQSSIMTIFSVWNTMMGSGLLALPWGFSEAGIFGGIAIVILVGLLAWYTCWLVVKYGMKYDEFFGS